MNIPSDKIESAAALMLAGLVGSAKAIRRSLRHLPPDSSDAHYCGEWLGEIEELIAIAQKGGIRP